MPTPPYDPTEYNAHADTGRLRQAMYRDDADEEVIDAYRRRIAVGKAERALAKHATKPGLVTVAGKRSDDVAPGTLNSILKQSGLKP